MSKTMNAHPITRPPTPRQLAVLNFVTLFHESHKRLPSTRRIQHQLGFKSQNAAVCHLNALVRRKLLNHSKGGYSLPTKTP